MYEMSSFIVFNSTCRIHKHLKSMTYLTPEIPWLYFSKTSPKLPFLVQKEKCDFLFFSNSISNHKILPENYYKNMWKKFLKNSQHRLQDYKVWSKEKRFFVSYQTKSTNFESFWLKKIALMNVEIFDVVFKN
jgi:hypothetical protein